MKNVRDFGAVGDAVTNDTAAIQSALNGGDTVTVPAGTYLCGTLYLQSNTCLYLEAGATILATTDKSYYNADDYCEQNAVFKSEHVTGAHLITAVGAENISIKGEGIIDGSSHFWVNENNRLENSITYQPNPERPGQMIFICECKNVSVSDVTLKNSPYWHLFLHGCSDVTVRGIKVYGERLQYTNDGIDIDCCRNVSVSDCLINTGDDGITVRCYNKPLTVPAVCENITVTNCVISSFGDFGIRIGVGDGLIKNCVFSNIVIYDSHLGIGVIGRFSEMSCGVNIENVKMQNIRIEANRAFEIRTSNTEHLKPSPKKRHIKNVTFDDISGRYCKNSVIYGYENSTLSSIRFTNCDFKVYGTANTPECDERGIWNSACTDSAFEIKDAANIMFDSISIKWDKDNVGFEHDFNITNSQNVKFKHCDFTKGVTEK